MMGERTVMQEALFYGFSLDDHVPADHLLRSIDRFVDLGDIREHLRPYCSETGRPSIDPELVIRMLKEVHLNLAYRWLCRLGLGARTRLSRSGFPLACDPHCRSMIAEADFFNE